MVSNIKTVIIIVLCILINSLCYADIQYDDLSNTINEGITIPIKGMTEIMNEGITIVDKDLNVAEIRTKDTTIYINKFTQSAKDTVTLSIGSIEQTKQICFNYPVNANKIKLEAYDMDEYGVLKRLDGVKGLYSDCFYNLSISLDDIYYNINYLGYDTIKYDIVTDYTKLDPYVIGSLAFNIYLGFYIPFNGNSNVQYSSRVSTIPSTGLRYSDVEDYISYTNYGGDDPTLAYDDIWNTANAITQACTSGLYTDFIFRYNRTLNDTGMVLQKYDSVSGGCSGSAIGSGYTNISISSSCFSYNAAYVQVKIHQWASASTFAGLDYYCLGASGYELLYQSYYQNSASCSCTGGSESSLYETAVWISNSSSFNAYNNTLPKTSLVYTMNLTQGYDFYFYGPDSTSGMKNIINASENISQVNVTFNISGAYFNGSAYMVIQ